MTEKQKRILEFIEHYYIENGASPTIREIGEHFGFKSPRAVSDHVEALKREGVLAIHPSRKQRNLISRRVIDSPLGKAHGIPLLGTIAAGNPIEAIENPEEYLTLDVLGLKNNASLFALIVQGSSMINRGIHDGDIVIVKRQNIVGRNDVAVIRIGNEVTLKYIQQHTHHISLIPDNDTMEPITVTSNEDVEVLGKVVKLIRTSV
jgi:repressor LexA